MHIRLTTVDSPAEPATHGVLAGVVSAILGVAAHGFGGGFVGHGFTTSHLMILGSLAVVVGVARAGQVRGSGSTRARWGATAGALVGGQIATHVALAMLGHDSLAPSVPMLVWHAVAMPIAVAVLVVAERLTAVFGARMAIAATFSERLTGDDETVVAPVLPTPTWASTLGVQSASGVRGPPATV